MSNDDLKYIIARLLQDAQRIQQIEPNAGTAARIEEAKSALHSLLESQQSEDNAGTSTCIELAIRKASAKAEITMRHSSL